MIPFRRFCCRYAIGRRVRDCLLGRGGISIPCSVRDNSRRAEMPAARCQCRECRCPRFERPHGNKPFRRSRLTRIRDAYRGFSPCAAFVSGSVGGGASAARMRSEYYESSVLVTNHRGGPLRQRWCGRCFAERAEGTKSAGLIEGIEFRGELTAVLGGRIRHVDGFGGVVVRRVERPARGFAQGIFAAAQVRGGATAADRASAFFELGCAPAKIVIETRRRNVARLGAHGFDRLRKPHGFAGLRGANCFNRLRGVGGFSRPRGRRRLTRRCGARYSPWPPRSSGSGGGRALLGQRTNSFNV